MIEIRNLTYEYEPGRPVLQDISFAIGNGESVGLIGANGAGKSTLMRIMLGLLETQDAVYIDGIPVAKPNLAKIRKKLGFVLQNSDNQMFMPTVKDDIAFGLLNYGISAAEADQKTDEVLESLHISYLKDRYNHRISGGEKRMAAIAAVLAMEPDALLMDEPTSALDPRNRRMIIETIRSLKHRLNNMTIGLCGDLKFGRTVHSLISAMSRYEGIRFVFISPDELKVPDYVIEMIDEKGIPYEECIRLDDVITRLDILYMTRVQRERFFNEEDYIRLKDFYILTKKQMRKAKNDMYVLHPLPRVNEISVEVDSDPRAAYFRQVQYGVYVRMALILTLLGIRVNEDGSVTEQPL